MHHVIHLHVDAPAKPDTGAACNGCGVCCASEPCPVGVLVSGRRHGACVALEWHERIGHDGHEQDGQEPGGLYRCGLIERPADHLPVLLGWAAPALARAARRMIAAGVGCDCSLDVADSRMAAEEG